MNLNGDLPETMSSTSHVLLQKNKDDSRVYLVLWYICWNSTEKQRHPNYTACGMEHSKVRLWKQLHVQNKVKERQRGKKPVKMLLIHVLSQNNYFLISWDPPFCTLSLSPPLQQSEQSWLRKKLTKLFLEILICASWCTVYKT